MKKNIKKEYANQNYPNFTPGAFEIMSILIILGSNTVENVYKSVKLHTQEENLQWLLDEGYIQISENGKSKLLSPTQTGKSAFFKQVIWLNEVISDVE